MSANFNRMEFYNWLVATGHTPATSAHASVAVNSLIVAGVETTDDFNAWTEDKKPNTVRVYSSHWNTYQKFIAGVSMKLNPKISVDAKKTANEFYAWLLENGRAQGTAAHNARVLGSILRADVKNTKEFESWVKDKAPNTMHAYRGCWNAYGAFRKSLGMEVDDHEWADRGLPWEICRGLWLVSRWEYAMSLKDLTRVVWRDVFRESRPGPVRFTNSRDGSIYKLGDHVSDELGLYAVHCFNPTREDDPIVPDGWGSSVSMTEKEMRRVAEKYDEWRAPNRYAVRVMPHWNTPIARRVLGWTWVESFPPAFALYARMKKDVWRPWDTPDEYHKYASPVIPPEDALHAYTHRAQGATHWSDPLPFKCRY